MKNKAKARGAISLAALSIATFAAGGFAPSEQAFAQEALPEIDIGAGAASAQGSATPPTTGLPVSSPDAVGSKAPPGSAPALAPSQAPLDAFEPTSIVSDKVLRNVVIPSGDYNDAVKYTPGFYSSNPNGPLGDAKGGWRGFQDGQYNITFDGIPFGDENDPTHHSAAYFPAAFLGKVTLTAVRAPPRRSATRPSAARWRCNPSNCRTRSAATSNLPMAPSARLTPARPCRRVSTRTQACAC